MHKCRRSCKLLTLFVRRKKGLMNKSVGFCPDFGLCWQDVCPTSGLFPSTWPSVSKEVYPKVTIDFMSRQEPHSLLFILHGHFSGEVLPSVHDCSVYWARSVHTTFEDLEVIGHGTIRIFFFFFLICVKFYRQVLIQQILTWYDF